MTRTEAKIIAAWREAAADLGFEFTAPFVATSPGGTRFEALGLVHHFGGRIGTLISVGGEPSADARYPSGDGYAESCLGRTGYDKYDREVWIDTLGDWGFWGEPQSAPHWYDPGPHCHLNYAKGKSGRVA